ncbi:MAG: flagellar hook-length control protein FliK [Acidimicrobiales bacterium]
MASPAGGTFPGVASQLVSVLSPLRALPGGGQAVTIGLHPEALGEVRATIVTVADQVTVRLEASTDAGREALRQALPDLGQHLSSNGQKAAVVLADGKPGGGPGGQAAGDGPVDHGGSGADGVARPWRAAGPATAGLGGRRQGTMAGGAGGGAGGLDLRL